MYLKMKLETHIFDEKRNKKVNSIGSVDVKLNKTYGVHHVNVSSNDTNQINRHNNLIGKSRHVLCVDGVNFGRNKK